METCKSLSIFLDTAAINPMKTSVSRPNKRPLKPSEIDCDNDHKVVSHDAKTVQGTLRVNSCNAAGFARNPNSVANVRARFSSIIHDRLKTKGVSEKYDLQIIKTQGDNTYTEFTYTLPCDKERHETLIDSLKAACRDNGLTDTITKENQNDDSDSRSDSDERPLQLTKSTHGAKATAPQTTPRATAAATTQKATAAPTTQKATAAPTTQKATARPGNNQ